MPADSRRNSGSEVIVMIIMPVPKDIREFKPKFIGPLTKPQFFSVVGAGLVAAVVLSLAGNIGSNEMKRSIVMTIITIIDAPILACGFITIRNLPILVYIRDVIIRNMLAPSLRPYHTENSYEKLGEQTLITYEYFDPDFGYTTNKKGERVKVKSRSKAAAVKLEDYYKEHPEMRGME